MRCSSCSTVVRCAFACSPACAVACSLQRVRPLQLILKFMRALLQCRHRGTAPSFHLADALFQLLHGRPMRVRLFAGLRSNLLILA